MADAAWVEQQCGKAAVRFFKGMDDYGLGMLLTKLSNELGVEIEGVELIAVLAAVTFMYESVNEGALQKDRNK